LRRSDVIANEQVLARELIGEFDHPDIGLVRQTKPAARFERTPAEIRGPAPRIGEHSAIILADRGSRRPRSSGSPPKRSSVW
jgi:crotonobetainyl-CoA:carnitine CoA-transferase CaiB-like acyl-CoA transferase